MSTSLGVGVRDGVGVIRQDVGVAVMVIVVGVFVTIVIGDGSGVEETGPRLSTATAITKNSKAMAAISAPKRYICLAEGLHGR